jgi:TetR/AcrR family transcriptional repressor of nem operon
VPAPAQERATALLMVSPLIGALTVFETTRSSSCYGPPMARTKEFDPDTALEAAMRLFWRDGYEGTSTSALVDDLGIARASLYGTFGSKRSLYLAALDRFIASEASSASTNALSSDESAIGAIRALLESSLRQSPELPAGCFAVNAGIEHGDTDAEVSRRLNANRRRLEIALYGALTRAQADGDLAPGVDPKQAAAMLVGLNTGLKVLARAGAGQNDRIAAAISAAMSLIAAPQPAQA